MTLPRFETLIERHHDEIYGYLWQMLRGTGLDAQDYTQEAFMRAYQAYPRLRADSNCRAWLYKIATNCAYSALRRGQRETDLDETLTADGLAPPEETAGLNMVLEAAFQIIETLPVKQRAAVMMRHIEGFEYHEIAQALDCSEESARAHVSLAVRRLRRELEDQRRI
ncbi:MAG: RNA polymerase sigma factor [Anaerolineae bacterium]|nr:RNA polymerase sigma factor [Anaerolineae bacterium]